ncbi:hypothetical protein CVM73_03550 [Bradyrhizobium forestalis]|uniref:Peptidase S8/S53 domain-containing protein n=1 Tax=Bradyrhizobium forestalis TaxID=1419263 RepID=A0A2M8RFM8_9BRAD|nr:S8 family serine peptidase [Bradyrhizobium forestalis]PJG56635.1 hypothetical protein CVM73_03550 [Bradyrhizobium forestalis]
MAPSAKRPARLDEPVPTGNYLVQFEKGLNVKDEIKLLHRGNGRVATASDFKEVEIDMGPLVQYGEAVLLDHIGVAVLRGDEGDKNRQLSILEKKSGVRRIYPEFYIFAHTDVSEDDSGTHEDSLSCTWGIEAVGACASRYSGRGIKVAVLDTGFDRRHPDYAGRLIKYWSAFGCDARDVRGHGTHCAGTAAGPRAAHNRMRYGVAPEADLHVYKVLDDGGTGGEGQLLLGINQAMVDGCDIMSMSCGRSAGSATTSNPIFDDIGQAALDEGRLMIAAAGNSSSRDIGYIAPIDFPANSPTIMSVAAVDSRLGLTNFSSGVPVGTTGIDIAAPGAGVFSSVPMPRKYQRLRGTSMAAPHVAGSAALWAESDPSLRATKLWDKLVSNAKALPHHQRDVGAGLVQAPR